MENLKERFQNRKIIIFVFFMIIFIIMLPYLQKDLVIGDDYEYHISRIESIKDSLKTGNFPVKIHSQLANSYGYASGMFYPNLFIYIPAIIGLFGVDLVLSYKIFIAFMLCVMFFITYYSLKNITENRESALIGTIIIMLSKNVALNLFQRFALGEFLGFIFITPVISGMYDYIHKDFKKPQLLFIGFFGLINSHLITTIICLAFCILYFLVNIKSTIKNPKKIVKLIITSLLVVFLTSYFWMPMLEQMTKQEYKFSEPWTKIGDEEFWLYDLFGTERYSTGIFITLCLPLIIYGAFDKNISKNTKSLCIWFIAIVILNVNFTIWNLTNEYSNIIQFKWRLVGILTVIAAIAVSLLIKEYCKNKNWKIENILAGILIISIYFTIQYNTLDLNNPDKTETLENLKEDMYLSKNSCGGGQEYLPIETEYEKLLNPYQAISDSKEKVEIVKTGLRIEFQKKNPEDTYFEVPFVYYYGYIANLTDAEGNVTPLNVEKSDNGLVKVITNDGIGNVCVWYNGTKIQKVSYIVSGIFVVLSILYFQYELWGRSNLNFGDVLESSR